MAFTGSAALKCTVNDDIAIFSQILSILCRFSVYTATFYNQKMWCLCYKRNIHILGVHFCASFDKLHIHLSIYNFLYFINLKFFKFMSSSWRFYWFRRVSVNSPAGDWTHKEILNIINRTLLPCLGMISDVWSVLCDLECS